MTLLELFADAPAPATPIAPTAAFVRALLNAILNPLLVA